MNNNVLLLALIALVILGFIIEWALPRMRAKKEESDA